MSDDAKRVSKAKAFEGLRTSYAALPMRLQGFRGFDRWFGQDLNNAKLALISTYNTLVPRFTALLASVNGDMAAFHREVARISQLEFDARRDALPDPG
jgi:predicted aminopeptidase